MESYLPKVCHVFIWCPRFITTEVYKIKAYKTVVYDMSDTSVHENLKNKELSISKIVYDSV